MMLLPILIGSALIGSGLWLKSQDTEQQRIQLEQTKLRVQHPGITPGGTSPDFDALLPAALALAAVSGVLLLKG